MKRFIFLNFFICLISIEVVAFPIIGKDVTTIFVSQDEESVVLEAVEMFRSDVKLVSEREAILVNEISENTIIVGTLGVNPILDRIIEQNKINIEGVKDEWEAFQIEVADFQSKKILLVVGSDKRGTAYGILELSRIIGVSPWVWWADSHPVKKKNVDISDSFFRKQKPSVQYRGIFINDEGVGFTPWSVKTFDPKKDNKSVGPKTYSKVFELMLRLRANIIWPAMHPITTPFYLVEGNKEIAQKYGIIIGTSHHEPLMRNTEEWNRKKHGAFNFQTNRKSVLDFWTERVNQLHNSENFYTVGMRGAGDVGMEGVKSVQEQADVLNQVFLEQRNILAENLNPAVEKIPQLFVPYKEVLEVYDKGLNIPDDITLMWCDDNYGYLTKFNTDKELSRSGGSGIYYHVSYWGRPHEYTWISTTPPAFTYWQMKKAYESGARKVWIVNVGDIKPAEFDTEFFLDLAWDFNSISEKNILQVSENWFAREFGEELAPELNAVMNEYYRLAFIRKPELMGWSRIEEDGFPNKLSPVTDTEFNPFVFGDQIYNRINDYESLMKKTEKLRKSIPDKKKDSYFQLIYFPVHAAGEMNKKLLYAQKARLFSKYNLPVTNEYIWRSLNAHNSVDTLVNFYNRKMSNGKWNGMMHSKTWRVPVYFTPNLPDSVLFDNSDTEVLLWPENYDKPITNDTKVKLTSFVNQIGMETNVYVFSRNNKKPYWKVNEKPSWIEISERESDFSNETCLIFRLKSGKLKKNIVEGNVILTINKKRYTFEVSAIKLPVNLPTEHNKLILVNTAEFENQIKKTPTIFQGLGHSTRSVELNQGAENAVIYSILTTSSGQAEITLRLLPVHPIEGDQIRYAVAVNDEKPQIVSFESDFINRSEEWKSNVSRNQAVKTTTHFFEKAGQQKITIYALDKGVVLDQLSVDFSIGRHFYELPRIK